MVCLEDHSSDCAQEFVGHPGRGAKSLNELLGEVASPRIRGIVCDRISHETQPFYGGHQAIHDRCKCQRPIPAEPLAITHEYVSQKTPITPSAPIPPGPHSSIDMTVVGWRFAVSPSMETASNDRGLKAVHFL